MYAKINCIKHNSNATNLANQKQLLHQYCSLWTWKPVNQIAADSTWAWTDFFFLRKICARTHFFLLGPLASIDTFNCRSTQPQISLTKRLLNHAVMFSVQEADGLEIMLNIHIDPCFPKAFSKCSLVPFGKTLLIVYWAFPGLPCPDQPWLPRPNPIC